MKEKYEDAKEIVWHIFLGTLYPDYELKLGLLCDSNYDKCNENTIFNTIVNGLIQPEPLVID